MPVYLFVMVIGPFPVASPRSPEASDAYAKASAAACGYEA